MSFNPKDYIKHLAIELIRNFEFARAATTPVLIGTAREKEVAQKLEMLLPNNVGVGSGCIIDSYGNVSKQMDIILYEKEFCPIFRINNADESTYYPCEGVICAGEVKSTLNSKELENIFEKSKSVKNLTRYEYLEPTNRTGELRSIYRPYNSKTSFHGTQEESFNQKENLYDQVFFFALCGDLELKPETLCDKFLDKLHDIQFFNFEPNAIVILSRGHLTYLNHNSMVHRMKDADSIGFLPADENNFEVLLGRIVEIILGGRTVPVEAFKRYLKSDKELTFNNPIIKKI